MTIPNLLLALPPTHFLFLSLHFRLLGLVILGTQPPKPMQATPLPIVGHQCCWNTEPSKRVSQALNILTIFSRIIVYFEKND